MAELDDVLPDLNDEENSKKEVADQVQARRDKILIERSNKSVTAILKDLKERLSFVYLLDFFNDFELFRAQYEEEQKNIQARLEFMFRMIQAQQKKAKRRP
uniref:Uncharacterized protein n=1 Tax=Strombidium inclinatum TaxID=197538 RepID=A0A7S3MY98_9SPIT|mmetsp:Transcript_29181/g.43992  ORF Transcript_29181/g.43992 Transcript_29181/m.43992 type:complete len:101 (+) Transcript_29181:1346-1648(+)